MNVFYSTPSTYATAKIAGASYPLKTDDFFPYGMSLDTSLLHSQLMCISSAIHEQTSHIPPPSSGWPERHVDWLHDLPCCTQGLRP